MRRAVSVVAVAMMAFLFAGCAFSRNYVNVCTQHDLTPQQLQEVLQGEPPQTARGTLGGKILWIPLIMSHMEVNRLERGEQPGTRPPVLTATPDEQWLQATELWTAGPLTVLWARARNAQFHIDGKNFGYYRNSRVLWGLLWWDKKERPRSPEVQYMHNAGLLFAGFGAGSKRTAEEETDYIRFFWIPIPISHNRVISQEAPPAAEKVAATGG